MSFYAQIYSTLCSRNVNNKINYLPGSGLHCHHITPRHSGGTEDESNFTYLTVREHIIAHWLLWKIHGNINDLRSMHMLGARLTSSQRVKCGEFCRDNKLGIFGRTPEQHREDSLKGIETQRREGKGMMFDKSTRKKYASLGGKASFNSPNSAFKYWTTPEGRSIRGRMGALVNVGKRCMYRPGDTSFIRVSPENIEEKLNCGFVFGSPLKPRKGKAGSTKCRKRVSDGTLTFDSLKLAAEHHGVTSSSICGKLKKPDSGWAYVSEDAV
jgi:hypothetical protein